MRLLVAQVLMAVVLTALLAILFYADRNRTVAQLVAARWLPALQRVAQGEGLAAAQPLAPSALYSAEQRPASALGLAPAAFRLSMLVEALREAGLPVAEALLGPPMASGSKVPTVWLNLRPPATATQAGPSWTGFESDLIEARLRERVVLAVALVFALAVLGSALISRRLAQPLEALRARIAADDLAAGPLPHASTEMQAIDAAWRDLRASLDRQERERALLLAGVSHDLRSPLGRIRMAAELLPDAPGVDARREAIVRNASLADRLVGSFLDHVRSGELPMDEVVDLAQVARSVAAQRPATNPALVLDLPDQAVVGAANEMLIERVITNLLDNAECHGRPPVRLAVSTDSTTAWIEVADHGPGIPAEQQAPLLQAFARADASRNRPGLGLGLSVVQRVATRLGGRVVFVSAPVGGEHAVRVEWPLSAQARHGGGA
jgi:two-component system, OmpR family, osmolarity sensor histidine kinase EnvZ